jgi:hypothetical protein
MLLRAVPHRNSTTNYIRITRSDHDFTSTHFALHTDTDYTTTCAAQPTIIIPAAPAGMQAVKCAVLGQPPRSIPCIWHARRALPLHIHWLIDSWDSSNFSYRINGIILFIEILCHEDVCTLYWQTKANSTTCNGSGKVNVNLLCICTAAHAGPCGASSTWQ